MNSMASSVSVVARQYDLNANQVFSWRRRFAAGVPVFDPWGWTLHTGDQALEVAEADGSDALAKTVVMITRQRVTRR